MKFPLTFTNMTQEQIDLLNSPINSVVKLLPQEKCDRYIKKVTGNVPKRRKKYHFIAIICCNEHGIVLFNGFGEELKTFGESFQEQRACREFAYTLYINASDRKTVVGGYYFDFVN